MVEQLEYRKYNDDYIVFENGDVFKKQKHIDSKRGYFTVSIYGKKKLLHRVIMESFKGKSNLTVDHIDGNKKNNSLDNLEYVTQKENTQRMFKRVGTDYLKKNGSGKRKGISIIVNNKEYESIALASRETGIPKTTLRRKLKNGKLNEL